MKRYVSLASKITVFTTAVIITTGFVVALVVYSVTDSYFLDSASKNLNASVNLIGNDIENSLMKIADDLVVLSKTPPINGIVRSVTNSGRDVVGNSDLSMWKNRLATIFSSLMSVRKNYTQIRYIGVKNNGKEIVRVDQTGRSVYRVDDSALQEKGGRDYFNEGVRLSPDSILFSRIDYNVEHDKVQLPSVLMLRALMPVYTDKQNIFGLLAINININRYLRRIFLRSASAYNIVLMDDFDDYFVFNRKKKSLDFFRGAQDIEPGVLGNAKKQSIKTVVEALKKDPKRITILRPIYTSHYQDQREFTLFVSVTKASLMREDARFSHSILVWVISICVIASLLIFLYAKRVMAPLSAFANTIKEMAHFEDVATTLPTHLNDEVGLLARVFEQKTKVLKKLALFDSLTGLPNRKNYMDHLNEFMHRADRNGYFLAVIFIDVNKFKEVNDTYGHDFGDELLIQVASVLQKNVRASDFCCRLGGDEFALIIESVKNMKDLDILLEKFQSSLSKTYIIKGIAIHVRVSGGVALYPKDASGAEELLRKADEAMYYSKKECKGNFCLVSKLNL